MANYLCKFTIVLLGPFTITCTWTLLTKSNDRDLYPMTIPLFQPRMINVRMRWHEKMKKMTSFFVGTPPEYDLAVYTLCILTRTGRSCPIKVDDDLVTVQSFEVKHVEGIQVASIFLAI